MAIAGDVEDLIEEEDVYAVPDKVPVMFVVCNYRDSVEMHLSPRKADVFSL